jgi:hypothetical protein
VKGSIPTQGEWLLAQLAETLPDHNDLCTLPADENYPTEDVDNKSADVLLQMM